jgi:hypothetical protein
MAEKAKAGRYELLDLSWNEITSDPGAPVVTWVRHEQGEILELDEDEATRMVNAGSVAPEGELAAREAEQATARFMAALAALPDDVRRAVASDLTAEKLAGMEVKQEDLHVHHADAVGFTNVGHPRNANAAHGEGTGALEDEVDQDATQASLDDGAKTTRRARQQPAVTDHPAERANKSEK